VPDLEALLGLIRDGGCAGDRPRAAAGRSGGGERLLESEVIGKVC